MFKRFQNLIFVLLFIAILAGPMISWSVISCLSINNPSIMESFEFDLNEKRKKATISEAIDLSKLSSELENYYNDRLPFRSALITFKRYLDAKIEEPYKNKIEGVLLKFFSKKRDAKVGDALTIVEGQERLMDDAVAKYLNHGLYKDEIDPYDATIEFPIKYLNNPRVIQGQSDWLYLNENNIPYYLGTNVIASDSEIKKHIAPYLRLKKKCDQVGKRLVILICPEKEEIYPEYMPTMDIVNEKEAIIYIRDYIRDNTDLTYIYPKEELLKYKKDYIVYKKYDSHWNAIGGYIASNEIKKSLGVATIPLRELKLRKEPALDADLAYYGNTSVESFPMSFKYVFENYKLNHHPEYVFAKDPLTLDSFTTHCAEGFDHKVFLIGDSFREALEEFLIKDFNELYCNTFVNATDGFIKEEVKRADDIVITLVERNEGIVLPQLCDILYNILGEYQNEVNTFIRENSK
ncbi:MAG: hypothetical protein J6P02_01680 [Lachnospiraceae bacterium]|nr:hypothetical protein [Lachnospiraceae bacterium]